MVKKKATDFQEPFEAFFRTSFEPMLWNILDRKSLGIHLRSVFLSEYCGKQVTVGHGQGSTYKYTSSRPDGRAMLTAEPPVFSLLEKISTHDAGSEQGVDPLSGCMEQVKEFTRGFPAGSACNRVRNFESSMDDAFTYVIIPVTIIMYYSYSGIS